MRTYDTIKTRLRPGSLIALLKRLIDRERELICLRNAVGMMSEARRADAREYHEMADVLRAAKLKTVSRKYPENTPSPNTPYLCTAISAVNTNYFVVCKYVDGQWLDHLSYPTKIVAFRGI